MKKLNISKFLILFLTTISLFCNPIKGMKKGKRKRFPGKGVALRTKKVKRDSKKTTKGRKRKRCHEDSVTDTAEGNNSGPTGLENLGNSCFMNAAIQVLNQIPPFRDALIENRGDYGQGTVTSRLASLMNLLNQRHSIVKPEGFFHHALPELRDTPNGEQEDADVFLKKALNSITEAQTEAHQNFTDVIDCGSVDTLTCSKCGQSRVRRDIKCSIEATIPNLNNQQVITLASCLDEYLNRNQGDHEIISANCPHCGQPNTSTTKETKLEKAPQNLLIQLKRFERNLHGNSNKIYTRVSFPVENFNIQNYLFENPGNPVLYNLQAMILHKGTFGGGHYIAIVKHSDGKWYNCNDSQVKEIPLSTVNGITTNGRWYQTLAKYHDSTNIGVVKSYIHLELKRKNRKELAKKPITSSLNNYIITTTIKKLTVDQQIKITSTFKKIINKNSRKGIIFGQPDIKYDKKTRTLTFTYQRPTIFFTPYILCYKRKNFNNIPIINNAPPALPAPPTRPSGLFGRVRSWFSRVKKEKTEVEHKEHKHHTSETSSSEESYSDESDSEDEVLESKSKYNQFDDEEAKPRLKRKKTNEDTEENTEIEELYNQILKLISDRKPLDDEKTVAFTLAKSRLYLLINKAARNKNFKHLEKKDHVDKLSKKLTGQDYYSEDEEMDDAQKEEISCANCRTIIERETVKMFECCNKHVYLCEKCAESKISCSKCKKQPNKMKHVCFVEKAKNNNGEFNCPICLNSFIYGKDRIAQEDVVATQCLHLFCRKCILDYRIEKCPLCANMLGQKALHDVTLI